MVQTCVFHGRDIVSLSGKCVFLLCNELVRTEMLIFNCHQCSCQQADRANKWPENFLFNSGRCCRNSVKFWWLCFKTQRKEFSIGVGNYKTKRKEMRSHTEPKLKQKRKLDLSLMFVVDYSSQRSWGKVIFLHLSVILLTGGVCTHPRADAPLDRHPSRADTLRADNPLGRHAPFPLHSACWDTVNKRAVRILLECNLVLWSFCMSFDLFRFRSHFCLAWICPFQVEWINRFSKKLFFRSRIQDKNVITAAVVQNCLFQCIITTSWCTFFEAKQPISIKLEKWRMKTVKCGHVSHKTSRIEQTLNNSIYQYSSCNVQWAGLTCVLWVQTCSTPGTPAWVLPHNWNNIIICETMEAIC